MQSTSRVLKRAGSAASSSSAAPAKKKGTLPISSRAPDADDLRSSDALAATLLRHGVGAASLALAREDVCAALEACLAGWVRTVAVAHGLTAEQAADAGCRLFKLGSCALGVAGPGSDVDCVAVVPYFVERRHFFAPDGLARALRKRGRLVEKPFLNDRQHRELSGTGLFPIDDEAEARKESQSVETFLRRYKYQRKLSLRCVKIQAFIRMRPRRRAFAKSTYSVASYLICNIT